jgi:glycosyltransferase involved in cell wall biosynthesis
MLRAQANRLAVLIPAYRPSDSLVDVVRVLVEKSFCHILVVDDGSGPDFADTFARVTALPGVEVLRHASNLGKGAALKTGLNHALCSIPDLAGVITADADGQHAPDDIERVGESLLAHPGSLVLGCREFHGEVPWRSRIGNFATSAIMHALMGRKMADTQTGLRGIPAAFALRLLKLEANGYEFELEMLVAAHKWGVGLVEESIRTIYEPGNPSSHFNPAVDSMKIYFVLLRFASVSLFTALLDNLIFILARRQGCSVLTSQILSRTVALVFNYSMVRSSVFYSRQRHKTVLPKYLLLALASGTVSYGGIRWLSSRFGIDAVPAKLAVETLLFMVNFTVQRVLIFSTDGARPRGEETGAARGRSAGPVSTAGETPASTLPAGLISALVLAVFLGALAVEAYGFRTANLFSQDVWDPIGVKRFLKYIGMYLGIAVPLLMMVPWSFAALITALTAVGTVFAVGPLPLLAVAFFLVSSCALGTRLLGRKQDDAPESQLFATIAGAAAWIFVMTLVARIPVNYPAVWAGLLAIPVLLDWRGTCRRLERWWQLLCGAELRGYAERAAFALVVFVLLAHWFVALMPEMSADGLAMHLAVPANIAANHAMTYEPGRFVWAVMPMGADFSYAIVYLLGGEYAAHLLDYTLLLLLEAVLYYAMRRWVSRTAAFLLLALFASTPLVQLVTGSLFVENVQAALVVGMMAALWRFSDTGEKRFLYVAAALGGTAMTTKFGALAFVALALPFLAMEAARHWKSLGPRPAAVCGLAVVLLLGTAVPPYAIAYGKTGNPLFPFLSEKFPSPLLPPNAGLVDERFKRPLTWNTPYDLTFHTNLAYEGQNGSFGFQYLVLAPLGVAAMLLLRRRAAVSATIVALGAAAIVMGTQPNARYVYAALPLLSVPFAALLGWAAGTRWLYRGLLAFVVACIAMNTWFMPSASYYHKDFCLRLPFSQAERGRYQAAMVPIRDVIAYFNSHHPNSPVMLSDGSSIAGLNGDVYENHWHQINNFWRIRSVKTVPEMVQLMQSWKVAYFISPKPGDRVEIKPEVFHEMLERCTELEFEQGSHYLSRLQLPCRPRQERVALLVRRGTYDDFDPALLFRGYWTKDRAFDGPDGHTISYTDVPGSEVEIVFEGKALTYAYTKAPNRGIASVTVDGVDQGSVDLYSPQIEWQSHTRFCCFDSGRHVAVIRLTGRADPKSTGTFIDLDSFTVE